MSWDVQDTSDDQAIRAVEREARIRLGISPGSRVILTRNLYKDQFVPLVGAGELEVIHDGKA